MDFSHVSNFDWIIMIALVVLCILMFSGNGGFLLRSKNAAKDGTKLDEKKAARLVGIMLLLFLILEVLNNFFSEQLPYMYIIYGPAAIIIVAVFLFAINKTCITKKR